jgi:hypothetical protein
MRGLKSGLAVDWGLASFHVAKQFPGHSLYVEGDHLTANLFEACYEFWEDRVLG